MIKATFEKVYLALWFQSNNNPLWQAGMAINGRYVLERVSWEITSWIASMKYRDPTGSGARLKSPKACLQWCNSFNKAVSLQKTPQTGDHRGTFFIQSSTIYSDILYAMDIYAHFEKFLKQQWSNPTYHAAVYSVTE